VTRAQCRIARNLIGLSREELAAAVAIPVIRIQAYEIGVVMLAEAERNALRGALELAGVEFIDGDQPSVRLTKGPE
jgi:ribosome-binding protein aMBF1 (putative translation factor)